LSPSSTSSLVRLISVMPLTSAEYRSCGTSNHPQRRGRPVVVPYSCPTDLRVCVCASVCVCVRECGCAVGGWVGRCACGAFSDSAAEPSDPMF
jgi:hypothetical protein